MDKKEIFEKVKGIISEMLGVDESSITLDSSFINDLKADSMDILELVSAFEAEFGITIPDEEGRTFETVREAVDFLASIV